MRVTCFTLVANIAALPIMLAAQVGPASNAELIKGDRYAKAHDFDLIHQRIAVGDFRWDSLSFNGVVTTTIVATASSLATVRLDEGALLANQKVTDAAGHPLRSTHSGDTLVIAPARPLRRGDTLRFTVAYHGTIKNGDGLTFINNDGLPHRPDQIWSMGETNSNHYWFPTYDEPDDKATWQLVATVPKDDLAISNGRLMSNVVTGDSRTMTWSQDTPASVYLASLIVAPLVVTHDMWRKIPVDYYTYRDDSVRARPLFHVTVDMIDTYSRLTGLAYPWAKYAQTTVADFFGGMENVSATTLVDWLPDARAYVDRPWYQHVLIPHELAHQWFGDYVTTANWANMWLNEGFAEFMPGQYWNEKLGARAEQDYYLDEYRQYLQIESRRSMPLASLGSNNIYPKGALVIKMLKDYLGPERFWASVHRYLSAHAFGNAKSDDVRTAVLAATGENLDWFWNEWIYGSGHPKFVVTAAYEPTASRLTLSVSQTQVDSFTVDSTGRLFSVAPAFRMPVKVRIGQPGGDIVRAVEVNAREQTIIIDSIRTAPSMIVFDDGNRMLKELTFEQPVAQLAEQLRRAPSLWDRSWAIDQLAQHPTDRAAAAALGEAATNADYFLTRAEAVDALGEFPATFAMSAVMAAARDTSSAVRSAALAALDKFGGDTVARVARAAFRSDSSYEVRSAALFALAHADPAHAHDAIAEALHTPSYQDAIQIAGMVIVAQTNDTTFLPQVDALAGKEELALNVVANLAIGGSARSLDLLAGHLDDPSAAVRRWTVRQFAQSVARRNKSMALTRLAAVVSGLKHAETRAAVTELIATLQKP